LVDSCGGYAPVNWTEGIDERTKRGGEDVDAVVVVARWGREKGGRGEEVEGVDWGDLLWLEYEGRKKGGAGTSRASFNQRKRLGKS
jgi:hypothetical protein